MLIVTSIFAVYTMQKKYDIPILLYNIITQLFKKCKSPRCGIGDGKILP